MYYKNKQTKKTFQANNFKVTLMSPNPEREELSSSCSILVNGHPPISYSHLSNLQKNTVHMKISLWKCRYSQAHQCTAVLSEQ